MPKRYFDDASANIKAGKVSSQLRRAIGYRKEELPIWIYRMRVLGYPPGWLRKARLNSAIISMHDEALTTNESTGNSLQPDMYIPEMFVEYPGFNVPVPHDVYDDYERHGMPPLLVSQQLDIAKRTILTPKPTPYKRIKIDSTKADEQNDSSISNRNDLFEDGEIDMNSKENDNDDENDDDDEIKIIEVKTNVADKVNTKADDVNISKELEKDVHKEEINDDHNNDNKAEINKEEINEDEQTSKNNNKLKLITMGSPLPVNSIPTAKPTLDKFADGMGELIYFENLAESTGAFDKMRCILKRVREKLSE